MKLRLQVLKALSKYLFLGAQGCTGGGGYDHSVPSRLPQRVQPRFQHG